jgi:hypothetical protein
VAVILWISFLLSSVAFADCGDAISLKNKINQLKIEAACSSVSLHGCLPLLESYSPHELKNAELSRGERCDLDLQPLSRPTVKLATTIAEGKLLGRDRTYVNSLEEFYEHTRLHRVRVKLLGMELLRTHPELFRGISPEELRIVLEAHDRAKVSSAAHGPSGRPFYEELYRSYGKKAPDPLVNSLNQADEKYAVEALKHAGLWDNPRMSSAERMRRRALRTRIKMIEKIADLVDRGKSPVTSEEFGRAMRPASTFLNNPEEVRLARELERNYSRLTVNLDYRPLKLSQAARISRQLMRSESFSSAVRRSSFREISLRAMTYHAIRRSKAGLSGLLHKLSTPLGKKLLLASDIIGLYFGEMDQLGCDGIGYHDWVKDPNCTPAIGLTPKVVQFLNEDFETQVHYLNAQPSTCRVISETYQESIVTPVVKSCSPQLLVLELGDRHQVRVHLDGKKHLKQIELGGLGREVNDFFRGTPEKVNIGRNGTVSKVCYKAGGRETVRTCVDRPGKELTRMNEFMKSINFQIQKAISACL